MRAVLEKRLRPILKAQHALEFTALLKLLCMSMRLRALTACPRAVKALSGSGIGEKKDSLDGDMGGSSSAKRFKSLLRELNRKSIITVF